MWAIEQCGECYGASTNYLLKGVATPIINNIIIMLVMHFAIRDMVMELMKEVDPDGVAERKHRKLKRREYFSKVCHLSLSSKLNKYNSL